MLMTLSQRERDTLAQLATSGPGGDFDPIALNKLFTLELIQVNGDRRVVLTNSGKKALKQIESLTETDHD